MNNKNAALDFSAISLSALCVIHCLALPLLLASLPVLSVLAEAEWVHRLLVLLALPITTFAIIKSFSTQGGLLFTLGAVCGLGLLIAGAFIETLHDWEVLLTTIGAITLALAHIFRWRMRSAQAAEAFNP